MSEDIYKQLQQFIPEGSNLKVNKFLSGQQTSAFQSKNEEIINDGKELISDLIKQCKESRITKMKNELPAAYEKLNKIYNLS